MKILYITLENLSLHKGSVVHVREIIAGLRKLGHEVGLIACSWDRFEKADRFYNLHKSLGLRRQSHFISSILLFFYLIKVLPRYDILYARDYHTVLIALIPRIIFNKRLVFEINGIANEEWKLKGDSILNLVVSTLIQKAEGLAARYSDTIVSVTPQIASYLKSHFHCSPDKIEVISNAVNREIFHPILDETSLLSWKKRLSLGKEDIVVTFIGNLAPWQGVNDLIQVAPALLGRKKNIRFLIIGEGVLKEDLEEEVRRLEISHHFLFTGMVNYDQIPFYINITDICVSLKKRLKSGYSPLKLYEYMACGKPVVASRVEGLEFIEVEGAGLLVEPGDLISLETGLFELLKDPQKREGMGRRGLQIVQDRFSWDSAALRIEKLLERLA